MSIWFQWNSPFSSSNGCLQWPRTSYIWPASICSVFSWAAAYSNNNIASPLSGSVRMWQSTAITNWYIFSQNTATCILWWMSCHVMSCHVMSCHVMSCHVMSCHVMSCHVMSYRWIDVTHTGGRTSRRCYYCKNTDRRSRFSYLTQQLRLC